MSRCLLAWRVGEPAPGLSVRGLSRQPLERGQPQRGERMGTYPGLGIVSIDTLQEASRDEVVLEGQNDGGRRCGSWLGRRSWRPVVVGSLKSAVGDEPRLAARCVSVP